ncbi:MAG: tetratricopeptide repeat protein [Cytophagales bacterium]|nr:tetratricopeptide repeat protein [Cytophagales bacterium]
MRWIVLAVWVGFGVGSRAFGQADAARTPSAHAFDSTLYFFEWTGKVAEKLQYLDATFRQLARYADGLNRQGRHEEALAVNWQALNLARQQGLREQLADAYNNLAATYEKKGDYETCLGYYLKALPVYESLGAAPGLLTLYRNLCALYGFTLGQYDKSLRYGDKALALARRLGDAYGVATVQVNRGVALRRTKRYGAALAGYREAYAIARQLNHVPLQEEVLLKMINIRMDRQQYDHIIAVAEKVLPLAAATRNPSNQAMALRGLAVAYLHRKDFARAQAYARQALDLCRRYDLKGWHDEAISSGEPPKPKHRPLYFLSIRFSNLTPRVTAFGGDMGETASLPCPLFNLAPRNDASYTTR